MSKCLIFHSVSILISSAAPLMGYWLLCYVPFIISFFSPPSTPLMFPDVVLEGCIGALQGLPEWDHTSFSSGTGNVGVLAKGHKSV